MKRLLLLNFKNFEFMTFHPSCINDIQIHLYNSFLKHLTLYVRLLHIQNLYSFCTISGNYQIITGLSILIEKIFSFQIKQWQRKFAIVCKMLPFYWKMF